MSRKNALLLIVVLSIMAVSAAGVGSWQPIKDLSSPRVAEVAKFAVMEYNKVNSSSLALVRVVQGEMQVVSGINYRLHISATNAAAPESYAAVVYAPLGNKPMDLKSFVKELGPNY